MASLMQRTRKLTMAWFSSSNSNTNQRQQEEEENQLGTDRGDDAQVTTAAASSAGEEKLRHVSLNDAQPNSLLEEEGDAAGSSADSTHTTPTTECGNTSPKSETQTKAKKNESDEKESDNAQRERRPTLFRLRTQSLANIFQLRTNSSLDSAGTTGEDGAVLDAAQADGPNEKAGLLFKEGGKWKTWKERWFILKDGKLYYRAADSVVQNKLLGKIDLLTAKVSLEERYTNAQFEMRTCIMIVSREGGSRGGGVKSPRKSTTRQYYLFAEEYFATGKWLEAMKRSVSRVLREERRRENGSGATTGYSGGNMSRSDGGVRIGAASDLTRSASLWASATYTPSAQLVRRRSQESLTPAQDETTAAKKKELKQRKKDRKKRKQKKRDKEEKEEKEKEEKEGRVETEPKNSEEASEEAHAVAAEEAAVVEEIRPEPEGDKRSAVDGTSAEKENVPSAEAPNVRGTGLKSAEGTSADAVDTPLPPSSPRSAIGTRAEETNTTAVPAP